MEPIGCAQTSRIETPSHSPGKCITFNLRTDWDRPTLLPSVTTSCTLEIVANGTRFSQQLVSVRLTRRRLASDAEKRRTVWTTERLDAAGILAASSVSLKSICCCDHSPRPRLGQFIRIAQFSNPFANGLEVRACTRNRHFLTSTDASIKYTVVHGYRIGLIANGHERVCLGNGDR